jgi:hypothetical protein
LQDNQLASFPNQSKFSKLTRLFISTWENADAADIRTKEEIYKILEYLRKNEGKDGGMESIKKWGAKEAAFGTKQKVGDIEILNSFTLLFCCREFAARLLVPLFRQSPNTANLKLIAFDDVREHLMSATMEVGMGGGEGNWNWNPYPFAFSPNCRYLPRHLPSLLAPIWASSSAQLSRIGPLPFCLILSFKLPKRLFI